MQSMCEGKALCRVNGDSCKHQGHTSMHMLVPNPYSSSVHSEGCLGCVEWCEYLGQQTTIGLSLLERLQRTTQHLQALSRHCCILLLDCPPQVSKDCVRLPDAIEVCISSRPACAFLCSTIAFGMPDNHKPMNIVRKGPAKFVMYA